MQPPLLLTILRIVPVSLPHYSVNPWGIWDSLSFSLTFLQALTASASQKRGASSQDPFAEETKV